MARLCNQFRVDHPQLGGLAHVVVCIETPGTNQQFNSKRTDYLELDIQFIKSLGFSNVRLDYSRVVGDIVGTESEDK